MKTMSVFVASLLFRATVGLSVDDIDVQLLQTRVLQKGPELDLTTSADLSTSAGENTCLSLESSSFSSWDCNGLEGRSSGVKSGFCNFTALPSYVQAMDKCCKRECDALASVLASNPPTQAELLISDTENNCLELVSSGWGTWDCKGAKPRAAAILQFCNTTIYGKNPVDLCCKADCDLLAASRGGTTTTTTKKLDLTTVSTTTSTTIPGGDTNPGGPDCFGAIARWGPDFDCNEKTVMFCGNDSPDGLDVSLCCQEHCGTNQEMRSKKREVEGDRKVSEGTRKSGRAESTKKRKEAESARKKQNKEDEWLSKRGAQETKNKNTEDERKSKRGFSAKQKANERAWKNGRAASKKAAEQREVKRKNGRADAAKKVARAEKENKNNKAELAKKNKTKGRKAATEAKTKKRRDATKKKKEKRAKKSASNKKN